MVHYFKESLRQRWLIIFSIIFFFLAINIPTLVLLSARYLPPDYLPLYLSYLVSLTFPYLPLLALPMGAISVVQEKESGTLEYILSTRITRGGYLLAKLAGLLLATTGVVLLGYGLAAVVSYRVSFSHYVIMGETILVAVLLNAIMLLLAMLVSILTKRRETALGVAIALWFLFAVISNLGQLGILLNLTHATDYFVSFTLLDPTESSRIMAVMATQTVANILLNDPTQLGVTGYTMVAVFGGSTVYVLFASLLAWLGALGGLLFGLFNRQDAT
ncbi:MAG: ABC transporter permease subunit [Nitrososphaerota archaeon]|nr:ABC transporter permease subunit [Nitrososphaerota archaeon]